MSRLAFVDCETTGISTAKGARPWEIALITRDAAHAGDREYVWHIRPDLTTADPMALKIGGYYERCQIRDSDGLGFGTARRISQPNSDLALTAAKAAFDIAQLLDGALLVGANPWFDAEHIGAFLCDWNECLAADYHMRDIGSLVTGYIAGRCAAAPPGSAPLRPAGGSRKLTDMARAMGLNPDDYDAHQALSDARLARDIWDAVMGVAP
jgi:hypothetical protein